MIRFEFTRTELINDKIRRNEFVKSLRKVLKKNGKINLMKAK